MDKPDLLEHGEPIFWGIINDWLTLQSHDSVDEAAVRQVVDKLMNPNPECEECSRMKDALDGAIHAMSNAEFDLEYAAMNGKEAVRAYDQHVLQLSR